MASSSSGVSVPASDAVQVLVSLLADESHTVREASASALKDIAALNPLLVLDCCSEVSRGGRRRFGNMAGLFQVMAFGVRGLDKKDVEPFFMTKLARIATAEMISSKSLPLYFYSANKQAEGWRDKPFPIYDRLLNIFGKDRATGIGAQTAEDMVNDRHLEDGNEDNEEIGIEDIPSPTSVNQTIHSSNQSGRKRKEKAQVDIVAGFSEVAEKMYKSFQMDANARMEKLTDILGIEDNYPKYLAVELKRLGFSTKDNLSISKSMRMDPSNVEVFKIIETDDEKIEFALAFKN